MEVSTTKRCIMNIITADEAFFKTVESRFPEHLIEISTEISKAITSGKRYVYIDEFGDSLTSKSLSIHMTTENDYAIDMIQTYLSRKGYDVAYFTGTVARCVQPDVSRAWLHISW